MIIKQVRLSSSSKDKLSRLKGRTGIQNWNVLCRWALCYSLSEGTMPTEIIPVADSNVEMSWYTFAGEYGEIYEGLVRQWCIDNDLPSDDESVEKYFKIHLERGIAHLSGTNFIKSLEDLLTLALEG